MVMNNEQVADWTDSLVRQSKLILERFKAGYSPSEGQLNALENALSPFTEEKLCGHKIIEDCSCDEE